MTDDRKRTPGAFLFPEERKVVEDAIGRAEAGTTGEVRVMISSRAGEDIMAEAQKRFAKLGMDRTEHKNGVLIMLALKSRSYAIVGDEAIHAVIGQEGWDGLRDGMARCFREGRFGDGLSFAVSEVGRFLKEHFPSSGVNPNELPDEVVEE